MKASDLSPRGSNNDMLSLYWTGAVVRLQYEPTPHGRAALSPEELSDPPGDDRRYVLRDARGPRAARYDVRPL